MSTADDKEKSTLLESKKDETSEDQGPSKRNPKNDNNNATEKEGEKGSKSKKKKEKPPQPPPTFKTKYFPWIVCATSFIVQFFVLGFYKSFGPVYVKLLQPEPEGYGGSPVATCKVSFSVLDSPIYSSFKNRDHPRL